MNRLQPQACRRAVGVLCLIQFVDVMGVTSATTAIPAILRDLGAAESAAGPLATAYAMFFGSLLVIGARLGDKLGHRRVLAAGLVGLVIASVIGGLAPSLELVLVARAAQGAAAAVSVPSALFLLLRESGDDSSRRAALALWSAAGAAAGAAGFVVGGVLVQVWAWSAVFWLNVPVGLLLLVALLRTVTAEGTRHASVRLDVVGGVLLVGAVMLLVAGASSVQQGGDLGRAPLLIGSGVLVAVAFAWRMRVAADPLVPRAAARSVNLRDGTVLSFVNTATTSSSAVLATLYLQGALGLSALSAGLTLVSFSILVIAGSWAAKPLLERAPARRVAAAGIVVIALSNLALIGVGATWQGVAVGMALGGFGIGVASVAATSLGTRVPAELTGSASGILNTGAQLGTALGTALVLMIAALTSTTGGWAAVVVIAALTATWAAVTSSTEPATQDASS